MRLFSESLDDQMDWTTFLQEYENVFFFLVLFFVRWRFVSSIIFIGQISHVYSNIRLAHIKLFDNIESVFT